MTTTTAAVPPLLSFSCGRVSVPYSFTPTITFIMPESSALIAHIVAQTRQNVEFLMSQDVIKRDEGHSVLAKLPTESDVTLRNLSEQTRRMTIPSPSLSQPSVDYPTPSVPPSGPPVRRNVPPAQPNVLRARALWSYNENGLVGALLFAFPLRC